MEPEGSLLHSQGSATCPYPGPHRSSPYPHITLPQDPSYYYLPTYAWVLQVVSIPQVSSPKLCIHFSPPRYITLSYCENRQFCSLCFHYVILHYNLQRQSYGKIWMHTAAANWMGRGSIQSMGSSYMKDKVKLRHFLSECCNLRASIILPELQICIQLSINDGTYFWLTLSLNKEPKKLKQNKIKWKKKLTQNYFCKFQMSK